jgi:4-alpha-glucanotransferase
MQRSAGILLPVSSLPSPYGIGCFSQEAYDFVDWLKDAGQTYWQILPLGVTSYGDSPYQSFSAFAGNPYFISLDELVKEGVLTAEECKKAKFGRKADDIDYSQLYKERAACSGWPTPAATSATMRSLRPSVNRTSGGWMTLPCSWR